jgi:hypothetical protein
VVVVVVVDGGGNVSATCADVPRDGVAVSGFWTSATSSGGCVVVVVGCVVEDDVDDELSTGSMVSATATGVGSAGAVVVVVEHGSTVVDVELVDVVEVVDDDVVVAQSPLPLVSACAPAAVTPTNNVSPATVTATVLPNNDRIDIQS